MISKKIRIGERMPSKKESYLLHVLVDNKI